MIIAIAASATNRNHSLLRKSMTHLANHFIVFYLFILLCQQLGLNIKNADYQYIRLKTPVFKMQL